MVCRCCFHATGRLDNLLFLPYNGNILTIGDIMPKPTYDQLVALVEYLPVPAEYENLPLQDKPKSAIEYCIKNRKSNVFSDTTEFDDTEENLDSVVDHIVELLKEYAYNFDYDQRDRIEEVLSENQPI